MSYIQIPPDSTGKKIFTHVVSISGTDNYIQGVNLVDHINPDYAQSVDVKGAAYVRFAEGEPKLDPYGNLKISRSVVIGSYDHSTDSQDDLYTVDELSGGTSTYEQINSRIVLATNTSTDAFVQRTTNRYHYYNTGTGLLALLTVQCGDFGKANNVREWGYFDDYDGCFYQLSGTNLNIVIRTTLNGVTTNTVVPQSSWSIDKLDGTGISNYELEIDEAENYWINIQWPGSIRFGVFNDSGDRIECHHQSHPNNLLLANASLPLRVNNYNIGSTISTSELMEYAMSIYHDNQVDYTFWRFSDMETSASKTITTQTPVLSIRSKQLYNGKTNRVSVYPQTLSFYISGGPAKMDLIYDSNLSGANWNLVGESSLEGDTDATSLTIGVDGYKFISEYFDAGCHNLDLDKYYELNDEGIMVDADGVTLPVLTFAFTRLTGNTTTVNSTLTYKELR